MASDTEANLCFTHGNFPCNSADLNICGPCQKLYELEEKITEVKRMLAGLDNEYRKLKEHANHTHNRLIHHLPLEVAGYIFELCIPEGIADLDLSESCVARYKLCAPFILSAVCRRWRTVALSTPRLWTTIPLSSYQLGFPKPFILEEWMSRSGKLPLSINLFVYPEPTDDQEDIVKNIIDVLNQYSDRWLKIKYEGPFSLLSCFSNGKQSLPQLQTLSLLVYNGRYSHSLKLQPTRLNTLSIWGIELTSITFDLRHLTQLYMNSPQLFECLEALRRAPCLTQCSINSANTNSVQQLPLPQNPVVHPKLQYLKITSLHNEICQHLSCPSLKSLTLEFRYKTPHTSQIVEFLGRSGCSLETLSLRQYAADIPASDIVLLFQGVPLLRHLRARLSPKDLLAHLAEFSIVNGKMVPRYLPALSSLVLNTDTFDSWEMIPNIFGPPGPNAHSTEYHRHALMDVKVYASNPPKTSSILGYDFAEETARRIVWLRDAGVKCEVKFRGKLDIIKLAIDRYGISTSLGEVA